ncbi:zinc-binding dehydrogenase, partial [Sphingomonas sp. CCH9-F2]|uniref:zinc-binding dehydrogenase n=1 Tax=Sphingomonas sp. CCH9-F2 TaxID=1768778 RepID=UPI000A67CC0C
FDADHPATGVLFPRRSTRKAVSVHWELMFTRSLFGTPDMAEQGRLLDTVAELVDASRIRTTATETLSPISAATLTEAHRRIESATTRGKIVLEGWEPRHD